jgi:hypothetical protein
VTQLWDELRGLILPVASAHDTVRRPWRRLTTLCKCRYGLEGVVGADMHSLLIDIATIITISGIIKKNFLAI